MNIFLYDFQNYFYLPLTRVSTKVVAVTNLTRSTFAFPSEQKLTSLCTDQLYRID